MHDSLLSQLNLSENNAGACAGTHWLSEGDPSLTSINPANGRIIASVHPATAEHYHTIMEKSRACFQNWRMVPAPKRGEMIHDLGELLRRNKDALGSLIAVEMGKIKAEGDGEVQEAIDMADFAVGQSRMLYGLTMHSERPRHRMYEQWHPLGPVAVITAFNFPMAVWAWNAFIAAIAGNTVIWKPSTKTPLCALALQHLCNQVMEKHGCDGVFSTLISGGDQLGQQLLQDRQIPLVSFTGSCATGTKVASTVSGRMGRCLLELGGNNAIIVDDSADLALAVPAIVFGAVGTAGQRCTTTRRVLVHHSRKEELLRRLANAYTQVRIGDPTRPQTLMGPLIDKAAVQGYLETINTIRRTGGDCIRHGGEVLDQEGFFVQPTIVDARPDWPVVAQETFAPILYVMPFQDLAQAIELNNQVQQGLSSAIFTLNLKHAETFLSATGSDCGIANVNIGTSGAEIGGAFGGEKATGGGREAGSDAWKTYMRRQTTTINWGDSLPLAQGISFDLPEK